MEKKIEDPTEKNEANKMFIIWFPVREPETSAGQPTWQSFYRRHIIKVLIKSRKQWYIAEAFNRK